MIPILQKGGKDIQLNALFFQPTRWCGLNCKGCYVKAHEGGEEDFHVSWDNWRHLFHLFYNGPHWANQITIAVDDLHKDVSKASHMAKVTESILLNMRDVDFTIGERKRQEYPEVHMTLHTPDTWWQYWDFGVRCWNKLSTVSFSTMPTNNRSIDTYQFFQELKVSINYNMTAPTKWVAHQEIEHIVEVSTWWADHINIVMFKTPIGAEDAYKVDKGTEYWQRYQLYKQEVVDRLPVDVRRKVSTDGCVSDTIKHSSTGFGCSANVSKFQVWPDGSVSGCPYAFSGSGPRGRTAEDIVENIREARKRYDFRERCHLPRVYSPLSARQGFRVLQIS